LERADEERFSLNRGGRNKKEPKKEKIRETGKKEKKSVIRRWRGTTGPKKKTARKVATNLGGSKEKKKKTGTAKFEKKKTAL